MFLETHAAKALAPVQSLSSVFADSSIDMRIVRAHDALSYELLEEGYDKLFRKFFADEEYQEPLSKWYSRLESKAPLSDYIIGISGTNLTDPSKRKLAGMFVGIYYRDAQTGLLAYNIVDDEFRGSGLGRRQVEARKTALLAAAKNNNGILRGMFCECNDPSIVPAATDIIDPKRRLEMYARMGGMRVPVNYICPSGSDLGDKLGNMMLLAFPHPQTGQYPSKEDTIAYLRGCYHVRGMAYSQDPDLLRMVNQINQSPEGRNNTWLKPLVDSKGKYRHPALNLVK